MFARTVLSRIVLWAALHGADVWLGLHSTVVWAGLDGPGIWGVLGGVSAAFPALV